MITLNLLPSEEKEKIFFQRVQNHLAVIGSSLIMVLLIFSCSLFLVTLYINQQAARASRELELAQDRLKLEGFKDLQESVSKINKQIIDLDKIQQDQIAYSKIFEKIVDVLPTDTSLKNLSLNQGKIIISGLAKNRQQVLEIKQALEMAPEFEQIESPVTNLIRATDVDFRFEWRIKKDAFKQ